MTTRPWHRSAAAVLAIPMMIAVVLYSLTWWFSGFTDRAPGYLQQILAQATPAYQVMGLVFVTISGAAAGAAYRRTGLKEHPANRPQWVITWVHLWPTLALGLLAWGTSVGVSVGHAEAVYLSVGPVPLAVAQLSMTVAWGCVGWALGVSPLGGLGVVAAPFIFFFVVGFVEQVFSSNLSGFTGHDLYFCCTISTATPTATVLGVLTASISLTLLAGLGFSTTPRASGVAAGLLGFATFAVISVAAITAAPYPPISPRAGDVDCSVHGGTTVCLWPEQSQLLPDAAAHIAGAADDLRALGVDVPTTITADESASAEVSYTVVPETPEQAHQQLISALTRTGPACGAMDENATPDLYRTHPAVNAWLAKAAGLDSGGPEQAMLPAEVADLRDLEAQSEAVQVDWVNATLAALRSCAAQAPPMPG